MWVDNRLFCAILLEGEERMGELKLIRIKRNKGGEEEKGTGADKSRGMGGSKVSSVILLSSPQAFKDKHSVSLPRVLSLGLFCLNQEQPRACQKLSQDGT